MRSTFILAGIVLFMLTLIEKRHPVEAHPTKNLPNSPEIIAQNPNHYRVSSQGIGVAKLGMTYQQLKKAIGSQMKFQVKTNFIVDWDAIELSYKDKVQYRILYPAGTVLKDGDVINALQTDNPQYVTDRGVGSGSLIKAVVSIYGKPTFSYNLDNEGREYVKFAKQPPHLYFRSGNFGSNSLSGIYPKKAGGYQETSQYKSQAKIQSIEVNCPPSLCKK